MNSWGDLENVYNTTQSRTLNTVLGRPDTCIEVIHPRGHVKRGSTVYIYRTLYIFLYYSLDMVADTYTLLTV